MDEFAKRSVFVKSGKFRYLGINFTQTAHDSASFVKKQGTLSVWRIRRPYHNYRIGLTDHENFA